MEVSEGSFKSFTYLAIGVLAGRLEKPTSTSFFGFKLLCQYVVLDIGTGIKIPAVYIAYQILCKLTLLVTSLINTVANLFVLKLL